MTNEEKASELTNKYFKMIFSTKGYSIKDCLLEMAQWKEQQMIEKACEWLEENIHKYQEYDESGFYHEKSKFLFNDFKKAMEEQL